MTGDSYISASARALLALALALLLSASLSASAGADPVHPANGSIGGLNHACGAAVDGEGDVYLASAGSSEVRIYDSERNPLGSLANANGPCALAVDPDGTLYVSESATGEVVRYEPTVFPFTGTPAYGPREVIDSSGDAEGMAVDPFDGRLYVARGDRVVTYGPDGTLGIDEVQSVRPFNAGSGFYKLSFEGSEPTVKIPFEGSASQVEEALEDLSTIGPGNVLVENPGGAPIAKEHFVTFTGALGHKDVVALVGDGTELIPNSPEPPSVLVGELESGFDGVIAEGEVTDATGVAAYTYQTSASQRDRYLFVADAATDEVKTVGGNDIRELELRNTNDGSGAPAGSFEFGAQGAYLAVDQGTCPPTGNKACTAGHVLVYDAGHEVVDEFEAGGRFLAQIENPSFEDGGPTAIAVDRSTGASKGTVYVTAGTGVGARALAFGSIVAPSRKPKPELALPLLNACGVAVDSFGNRYVAADSFVYVYGPSGTTKLVDDPIPDPEGLCELAVDEQGRVYAHDDRGGSAGSGRIVYFTPDSFPPTADTQYSGPTVIADTGPSFFPNDEALQWFALNPANGHVFVTQFNRTIELGSVDGGAEILDANVAPSVPSRSLIAVDGSSGTVFMLSGSGASAVVNVLDMGSEADPDDEEVIARIKGVGGPVGSVESTKSMAVDEITGHLLTFNDHEGTMEEYDETGTFVAQTGQFKEPLIRPSQIAVDTSGGPNNGYAYVAYFGDEEDQKFEGLHAFEPLAYGEPPVAQTGQASDVGGGQATLNGTVNPRHFPVESCTFEYISQGDLEDNEEATNPPFEGATALPCAESPGSLGEGIQPIPVHADVSGLDAQGRYYFRLLAVNEHGQSEGNTGRFGAPEIASEEPRPISYTEATVRATIDPWGLDSEYFVEYGPDGSYGQSTAPQTLGGGGGPTAVTIHLFGLAEASTYHFRVVATNEVGEAVPAAPDQEFTTLQRRPVEHCSNQAYRVGRSANLPDCRAYELVTPADARGTTPYAFPVTFNSWLVDPRGAGAGESLAFYTNGTLPGFEGNGRVDGYRAHRAAGEHPEEGWSSDLFAPTYAQAGGDGPKQFGIAPDQEYSIWGISPAEATEGALDEGQYLRTASGFEAVGRGSLGDDLGATGHFTGRGGDHVIFSSDAHLETAAAPAGTNAIYDRKAGTAAAEVISVKPGGLSFGPGEDASYLGANEDALAIAFEVGGTLYLRRGGQTTEVASTANTFAGISTDGTRVYYVSANVEAQIVPVPAPLFVCDMNEGACTGAGKHEIAASARFVNVSDDGSRVYLTSTQEIDGEGSPGQNNLYLWEADTEDTTFIGVLAPQDLINDAFGKFSNLARWPSAVGSGGRGLSPTRTTLDGSVFVFQSHANLTAQDTEGSAQIYRYDSAADPASRLVCVSCDPSGASPSEAATLVSFSTAPMLGAYTALVPNVTDHGETVLFESPERLLPEDANAVQDVYEWRAQGSTWCDRPDGCLALLSSGQADTDTHLYAMSADGHDIFLSTLEKLAGADVPNSSSIYDARISGGIPDPPAPAPCQGDACQGEGTSPPPLPSPASGSIPPSEGLPSEKKAPKKCPKSKKKVKRKGKVSCVKPKAKKKENKAKSKQRRANGEGRGSR